VSLDAVAAELSWPDASTRALYRKLEIRGEAVPPLTNRRVGKRLTVTCPHCLRTRSLSPSVVLTLNTDVCFECLHRPPTITRNKLVAECPRCGARRLLSKAQVAERSAGLQTLCRRCAMAKARAARSAHGSARSAP
jgi:DNA-directed RNA polymerase subunit RPC12/RpoP